MSNTQDAPIKVEVAGYTVAEAAELLGVSLTTVYRWLEDGALQAMTTLGGTAKLVSAESVHRYKRQRKEAQS